MSSSTESSTESNIELNWIRDFSLAQIGCAPHTRCCVGQLTTLVSAIALVIVGSIATVGAMPMMQACWLGVGFGSAMLVGNLSADGLKQRKIMAILGTLSAAAVILTATLGLAGVCPLTSIKAIGITYLTFSGGTYIGLACDAALSRYDQTHRFNKLL